MRNSKEKTILIGHKLNQSLKENIKINKENGVTLLALVVTIVILIILATISVNALVGENGLISAAQGEKEHQLNAIYEENQGLNDLYEEFDKVIANVTTGGSTEEDTNIYLVDTVEIGDYVSYDAGIWDQDDFDLITSSTGSPTVNQSTDLPTEQGQFGGFALGSSRNDNSTPYSTSYPTPYTGWRVWSKSGTGASGTVTLVHAGHSESYYHASGSSLASSAILTARNMSMYVNNEYGKTAYFMTLDDYTYMYNLVQETSLSSAETYAQSVTLENANSNLLYTGTSSTNGMLYWLVTSYDASSVYFFHGNLSSSCVHSGYNRTYGIRTIVTLNPGVQNSGGDKDNGWTLTI